MTVRQLCADPAFNLEVLAGHDFLDRDLSWAHVSELPDPTPFMDGGELLLTTGVGLPDDAVEVRTRVGRLARAGVAAIGFGTGLQHAQVPSPLVEAAESERMPLLEVPLQTPFLAITKAVSRAQSGDDIDRLRTSHQNQRRLVQAAVSRGGRRSVVRRLAEATGGWAAALDAGGEILEQSSPAAEDGVERTALERDERWGEVVFSSNDHEETVSHPLVTTSGAVLGYLVAGRLGGVGSLNHGAVVVAASLLTLLAAGSQEVLETMERMRNAAVRQVLQGELDLPRQVGDELWGGFPDEPFQLVEVAGAEPDLRRTSQMLDPPREGAAWGLVDGCLLAVVTASACDDLLTTFAGRDVHVGVSRPSTWKGLPQARRQAAQAVSEASSQGMDVVRFESMSERGLTAFLDVARSRAFAAGHLAPLREARGGTALYETLAAWLAHNGVNDAAANELGIHRHTLRNRLARVEKVLGVDLGSPTDRAELWLEYRLLGDAPTQ